MSKLLVNCDECGLSISSGLCSDCAEEATKYADDQIKALQKQLAYLEYIIEEVIEPLPVDLSDLVDSFEMWEKKQTQENSA